MNNITAEEVQASIIELLEAKQKNGTISSVQEEACYLAGAIQAIHLVYGENPDALDSVPPAWVFAPMSGRSVNDYNYDK